MLNLTLLLLVCLRRRWGSVLEVTSPGSLRPFRGRILPDVQRSLIGTSDYLHRGIGPDGRLLCPEHRLDHTGRSARSIVIDSALHALTGKDEYFDRACSRALTTDARLAPDPEHGSWIYHPGRLDPNNMSTSVIDSGDCTDALATFLLQFSDRIEEDLRRRLEATIVRNCDTYLVGAAETKEVPNQRLWGAMGLAAAYRVIGDQRWKDSVLRSLEVSFADQNPDGSFPYHPSPTDYGLHKAASGATIYYHSRHLAFAHYACQLCDEPNAFNANFQQGLNFLLATISPEGFKPLLLDSKPWFWQGPLEAGSHPYDLYAIAALAEPAAADDILGHSLGCLLATQDDDGAFRGVPAGPRGFNCRHFHTADIAWLARAAELAPLVPYYSPTGSLPDQKTQLFPDGGLVRVQTAESCALISISSGERNILYGARAGAGEIVYFGRRSAGWRNSVERWTLPDHLIPGWYASAGLNIRSNIRSYLHQNQSNRDLRFRLYIARTRLKSGRPFDSIHSFITDMRAEAAAALRPVRHTRHSRSCHATAFEDSVSIDTVLASGDGSMVDGITLHSEYRLDRQRLSITETLRSVAFENNIYFRPPPGVRDLACEPDCEWDTVAGTLIFRPQGQDASIRIQFEL